MENVVKRRDRHDIVCEILETARGGVIKTHMMYRAKLSYGQICEYVPVLLEKGFLENARIRTRRKETTLLKTTKLGEEFLENLRSVDLIWRS